MKKIVILLAAAFALAASPANADVKTVSQLPSAALPLSGAELVPLVQGGNSKQAKLSDILANLPAGEIQNSALATSSLTIAGHMVPLGGSQAIAWSDLTGTTLPSGLTIPGPTLSGTVAGAPTASGLWTFNGGATYGASSTVTFPGGGTATSSGFANLAGAEPVGLRLHLRGEAGDGRHSRQCGNRRDNADGGGIYDAD